MRTLLFIVAGTAFFFALHVATRAMAAPSGTALKVFVPTWLIIAAINLIIGVRTAGYTVLEELPIFLVIFGIPAAIAFVMSRRAA